MKKIFTIFYGLLFCSIAEAQVVITTPDTTICQGSAITLNATVTGRVPTSINITQDDYYSSVVNIGFTYYFYGVPYTQCVVSPNGFICFNTANAGVFSQWSITTGVPGNTNCKNAAMGFYADIDPSVSTGCAMDYAVVGTAPNRRFVVSFYEVPMFSCNNLIASFQMILYEGSNNFESHITNAPICSSWNNGYAIEGVQNNAGTLATTVPGRNYPSSWATANNSHRFTYTGSTYTVAQIPYAPIPKATSTLTWYANGTTAVGTGNSVVVSPTTTTFYVAKLSDCITVADTVTVTVVTPPAAPAVTSPVNYCLGATAVPLTASGTNLKWYTIAIGGTGSTTAPTPSTAATGSTTYYVSQSNSACESPRASITVTVTAGPNTPTATSPINYCQFATATALSATGSNLKWYITPTGGTGSTTAPTPSTSTTGTVNYYVSQTTSNCESNRATVVVNIIAKPDPPGTAPVGYCQNAIPSVLTATGSNLLWYTAATGGTGSSTAPTPATNTPGTTTYYVSQTVNGCESDRASITVTVNATATQPVVTSPVVYCQFQTATPLTATGNNLMWYTVATGGTGSTTAPLPNTSVPSTTNFYVSQSNGCESARSLIAVIVNAKPNSPTVTSPLNYCQFQTASILSATGNGLLWYTAPTGGTGNSTAPTPSTTAASNTNYYVSQTVNGCESDRASINVIVTVKPSAPVVSNIGYCQYQFSNALTATGSNLLWYAAPSGGTGSASAPVPNTSSPGNTIYYVSQTVSGCESDRSSLTVSITQQPAIPVVSNVVYCQFQTATQLTASGNSLLWYGSATTSSGSSTAPTPSTTTAGNTNYYVSQTISGCESNRAAIQVTVNAKPNTPAVTTPVNYCQNSTAVPLSAFGNNLLWYTAPAGGTGSTAIPTPSTLTSGTSIFYVSHTTNNCESDRASIAVNITEQPGPPTTNTSPVFCQYEPANALTAAGQNIKWYATPTGNALLVSAPIPNTQQPGIIVYYVTQTVSGCESVRLPVSVTVKPKPPPPVVQTPKYICQYETPIPLVATGTNLKWYPSSSGGLGATTPPVPNTGYEDTSSWWVTQSVDGCESDRSKMEVIVTYRPNGIILSSKSVICQYDVDTIWYFGNARGSAAIDWKILQNTANIVKYIGRDTIVVRFDSSGNIPIRMQAGDNGCVSPEAILNIYVRPAPKVSITTKPEICINEYSNIALNFSTANISDFHWNFGGGQVIYGQEKTGPFGLKWPSEGIYIVSVTATANQCTSLPFYDTIIVHKQPDAHIAYVTYLNKSTPICAGDSILLTATSIQTGSNKYVWTPKTYFNEGKGITDSTLDRVKADIVSTGYVYLKLTDKNGCKTQDSLYIDAEPCCNIYFPTAFTPNGDGKNDVFHMITSGHHTITSFRIVNRWGQTLFEMRDENKGWDGTYNGRPQDLGTYFYYIKYQCVNKEYYEQKGEVTLIR